MAYKLVLLKSTRHSLWEAMDWYNQQSPGLGHELMAEFFEYFEKLATNPHRNKYILRPYRRLRLKRFPYLIIFRIDEPPTAGRSSGIVAREKEFGGLGRCFETVRKFSKYH